MRNRYAQALLGILMLVTCTPQVRAQQGWQQHDRGNGSPPALGAGASVEGGGSQSLAEWWGRHKRALQYLSACALASASLSYAFIVGFGNPVGGAVLGLLGASIMVAICL